MIALPVNDCQMLKYTADLCQTHWQSLHCQCQDGFAVNHEDVKSIIIVCCNSSNDWCFKVPKVIPHEIITEKKFEVEYSVVDSSTIRIMFSSAAKCTKMHKGHSKL